MVLVLVVRRDFRGPCLGEIDELFVQIGLDEATESFSNRLMLL